MGTQAKTIGTVSVFVLWIVAGGLFSSTISVPFLGGGPLQHGQFVSAGGPLKSGTVLVLGFGVGSVPPKFVPQAMCALGHFEVV